MLFVALARGFEALTESKENASNKSRPQFFKKKEMYITMIPSFGQYLRFILKIMLTLVLRLMY